MEKLNYILYCWSQYIYSNRLIAFYLIALSVAFIFFIASASGLFNAIKLKQTLNKDLYFPNTAIIFFIAGIVTIILVIPFFAILLMQFQNVFYSYDALWTMALILPITAFALSFAIAYLSKLKNKATFVISSLLLGLSLLACGNMGKSNDELQTYELLHHQVSYEECIPLLNKLEEYSLAPEYDGSITILAPANITMYAHFRPGNVKTLYGKDMWDNSMAPLTYNEYPEDYCKLYTWIGCAEAYGSFYNVDEQSPILSYELQLAKFKGISTLDDAESSVKKGNAIGGITYFELASQNNIDIIVLYTNGNNLDTVAFDYILNSVNIRQDYIPINDTEGYILLFL